MGRSLVCCLLGEFHKLLGLLEASFGDSLSDQSFGQELIGLYRGSYLNTYLCI